jgi:hypothetical protein
MTISSAGLQSIQNGESLVDRTAARVANSSQPTTSSGDQVSLSDDAVALLQAKNQVAVGVRLLNVESDLQKTLLKVAS